jgi:DNA-binding MarR family transcriptional regulator
MSVSSRPNRSRMIEDLMRGLREVTGQSVLVSQAMATKLGINTTDLECLDFLLLSGPQTAGAIAEHSGLTTGAVTGIVDRLQRADLVRRTRERGDRRKVRIAASKGTDSKVKLVAAPVKRAMTELAEDYSDENLRLLLDFVGCALASLRGIITDTERAASAERVSRT